MEQDAKRYVPLQPTHFFHTDSRQGEHHIEMNYLQQVIVILFLFTIFRRLFTQHNKKRLQVTRRGHRLESAVQKGIYNIIAILSQLPKRGRGGRVVKAMDC